MNLSTRLHRLEAQQPGGTCPHLPPQITIRRRGPSLSGYPGDDAPQPAPDTRACACGRARQQIVIERDMGGEGDWQEKVLPTPPDRAPLAQGRETGFPGR